MKLLVNFHKFVFRYYIECEVELRCLCDVAVCWCPNLPELEKGSVTEACRRTEPFPRAGRHMSVL